MSSVGTVVLSRGRCCEHRTLGQPKNDKPKHLETRSTRDHAEVRHLSHVPLAWPYAETLGCVFFQLSSLRHGFSHKRFILINVEAVIA